MAVTWATIFAAAQERGALEQILDTIRGLSDIGATDQERIARWITEQIQSFTGHAEFPASVSAQFGHAGNSPAFKAQLVTQTAQVAANHFTQPNLPADAAFALARVLVDMGQPEAFPGLVVGLQSSDARARYLCARGLGSLKQVIGADKTKFETSISALRDAGVKETDAVVLGRIYEALGHTDRVPAVFSAYMNILDQRLATKRKVGGREDGAEIFFWEFFGTDRVRGELTAEQKVQLVNRLAVLLRLAAERYNAPNLTFDEIDRIERVLDGMETILEGLLGTGKGGKIREVLATGGQQPAVAQEAYRWVGDPRAATPGALNEPPWNVAIGAP